jgi:hypothetical protein
MQDLSIKADKIMATDEAKDREEHGSYHTSILMNLLLSHSRISLLLN